MMKSILIGILISTFWSYAGHAGGAKKTPPSVCVVEFGDLHPESNWQLYNQDAQGLWSADVKGILNLVPHSIDDPLTQRLPRGFRQSAAFRHDSRFHKGVAIIDDRKQLDLIRRDVTIVFKSGHVLTGVVEEAGVLVMGHWTHDLPGNYFVNSRRDVYSQYAYLISLNIRSGDTVYKVSDTQMDRILVKPDQPGSTKR